jgi:hypothetical protein
MENYISGNQKMGKLPGSMPVLAGLASTAAGILPTGILASGFLALWRVSEDRLAGNIYKNKHKIFKHPFI